MSEIPSKTIDSLVVAAQKGDTQAFGKLYDHLVKPVYRYLFYRVEPLIAEDLTEEVFFKMWQNLANYKKTTVPFTSWVFKIAHNLICDHYRSFKPVMEMPETYADESRQNQPSYDISLQLTQKSLRQALQKLPPSYQEVLSLRYMSDLSTPQIALTLGKSEGSLRTLQSRALAQLRTLLEDQKEDLGF